MNEYNEYIIYKSGYMEGKYEFIRLFSICDEKFLQLPNMSWSSSLYNIYSKGYFDGFCDFQNKAFNGMTLEKMLQEDLDPTCITSYNSRHKRTLELANN